MWLPSAPERQFGGPAADNQLTSLIAVVRSANENKCKLIQLMEVRQQGHGQVGGPDAGVFIRCSTRSYGTLHVLISALAWNGRDPVI